MTAFGGADNMLLHKFKKVINGSKRQNWEKAQCTFKVGGGSYITLKFTWSKQKKMLEGVQPTTFFFTTHTKQPFTMSDWGA